MKSEIKCALIGAAQGFAVIFCGIGLGELLSYADGKTLFYVFLAIFWAGMSFTFYSLALISDEADRIQAKAKRIQDMIAKKRGDEK